MGLGNRVGDQLRVQLRRARVVLPVLGRLYVLLGATMLVPLAISIVDGFEDTGAFVASIGVSVAVGLALWLPFGHSDGDVTRRDGFVVATFAWLGAGVLGGLPYVFSGTTAPVNALFEAISGFTTTGATTLPDVESLSRAILLWRSLTHWLGGLGIVVLAVAVLPFLGVAGFQLFAAEAPALESDRLRPRIGQTARMLWGTYVAVSAAEFLLLLLGGMGWFDSLTHTFGTIATGGFSTRNTSVSYYANPYFEVVITIFMYLSGLPFALHYRAFRNPKIYWTRPQFRLYTGILVGATVVVAANCMLGGVYDNLWDSGRHAAFQVVSIMTTTGFASADFEKWPELSRYVLFALMFVGGCAGSTGGAIKVLRVLILGKLAFRELFFLAHPRAIRPITLMGQMLGKDVLGGVTNLFALYVVIFAVATGLFIGVGIDTETALSVSAATLGNVGPGFGKVGPMDNYEHLPAVVKLVSSLLMLLGRLEIFTIAALLTPEFWRR